MTERSNCETASSNGTRKPRSMGKWTRALEGSNKWLVIPLLAISLVVVLLLALSLAFSIISPRQIAPGLFPPDPLDDSYDDLPSGRAWGQILQRSNSRYTPQWTPDSSHIVFTGTASVNVVRADGSELWRLSESDDRREVDHSHLRIPRWNPHSVCHVPTQDSRLSARL